MNAAVKNVGERGIALHAPITDEVAQLCIAQLLFLAHSAPHQPITLEIDSPGGSVTPSLAIIQMIDELSCRVCTFCRGHAGGTAAVILAHGARGFRAAATSATFSFAPVFGAPDRAYVEAELSQFDQALVELLATDCGKHEQEIYSLFNTHSDLTAADAIELRLVDSISDTPIVPSMRLTLRWSERLRRVTRAAYAALAPRLRRRSPLSR
jgi:ATP-dependent Clp protease protease subunit